MATRQLGGELRAAPGASLPIPPTAVVATVTIERVLEADAITSAVIRGEGGTTAVPPVLAYVAEAAVGGPQAAASAAPTAKPAIAPPPLTMTALDTAALRLWMGQNSTRQRGYALLTMPEFAPTAAIIGGPSAATPMSAAAPLRTDRFTPSR
jgi:hypothetical protein